MDVHDKQQRSYNMSQIRAKNSKPETIIAHLLNQLKISYNQHSPDLPGKPDFYIYDLNLVIEVKGCFWHGHKSCKYFKTPSSNSEFWANKISENILRDKKVKKSQIALNLHVCTVWECEVKNGKYFGKVLDLF